LVFVDALLTTCLLFSILIIFGSTSFGFTLEALTVVKRSTNGFLFLITLTCFIDIGKESARPPTLTFVFGFIKLTGGLFQLSSPKDTIIHL